ncbi:hypothetical protein LTR04_003339 [Oleoguttula sp. CCFEE 6159]|nr:hypothetical protein LTR04_003339 [Oleoguttula sp. CCFEE 6159]
MAWEHLDVNRPHLVYIILGGFTSLFMLCSSVIKERLYIGEATVATICGIIFGPHAANLIDPGTWGNTDQITLEFSRIVLVVQCFAVGVELPKSYMERHWRSVTFLLIPVMTFGWLITSLFIWWMVPTLNWLDSLCVAACVTATDPVLASSVVGKGKFAKRVPKHLRDLLSAESGCNDGMAFPFIYLAIYLLRYRPDSNQVAFHWFCYTILYECIFGAFYGVCVGYAARRAIRLAHEKELIDRESFLVFYFVLALFCAGSGSILGMDDLLIGFACGVGFSNDGWFLEKTEEAHVSNVIDLLINLAFFVYFGTIIPWAQYNQMDLLGLSAWRLVVIGILVLFFRRIPIMLALKPIIPDIKTWREALFAGHFGPIGVGALFVAILARAELETESTTPLAELPPEGFEHLNVIELIWPITTFLVIVSIIVHGSSIAVFTLGKHINTLTLTMSYTQANEEGPTWMDRLPRIQSRSKSSMSMRRPDDTDNSSIDEKDDLRYPPGALPPIGMPGNFLRRQREEDNPSRSSSRGPQTRRRKNWDSGRGPGGPISQSAIAPQARNRDHSDVPDSSRSDSDTLAIKNDESPEGTSEKPPPGSQEPEGEIYQEGNKTVYEDEEGNVLEVEDSHGVEEPERQQHEREEAKKLMAEKDVHKGVSRTEHEHPEEDMGEKVVKEAKQAGHDVKDATEHAGKHWRHKLKRMETFSGLRNRDEDEPSTKPKSKPEQRRGPALAYQFGNTIIVEDENGEVLKKYDIPAAQKKAKAPKPDKDGNVTETGRTRQRLQRMSTYLGMSGREAEEEVEAGPSSTGEASQETSKRKKKPAKDKDEDDDNIRFTVASGGRRMSKAEFIQQIKQLDPKARAAFMEESNVPETVKNEARQDAKDHQKDKRRAKQSNALAAMPEHETDGEGTEDVAALKKVGTNEDTATGPQGLTLIDSNGQDIPFHDVSSDLNSYPIGNTGQETAAQRRRRQAAQQTAEEDSDDDGTERVPPSRPALGCGESRRSGTVPQSYHDAGETAAERRRREGALGVSKEESDSDEDESKPREVPRAAAAQTSGDRIRFVDPPPRTSGAGGSGGSRLRWGKNVGR